MPNPNAYLLIFAIGFMGCVLATPVVTRFAVWLGAIDRPDQFRRIHKGATPRMGGLGLAFGLVLAVAVAASGRYFAAWDDYGRWLTTLLPIALAAGIILAVGVVDDNRELSPRLKLLGQGAAVLVLYLGGVRIDGIEILQLTIPLSSPAVEIAAGGWSVHVALPGLLVTSFWFLACMNIWNLIDGMDGLASGVGLMVCGTLALVAIWLDNPAVAILAAALAGGLAGFLLYNWHPACIFLGDSGSLLIGLTIGIIGVQGSLKPGSSISLLFPILAMGLPITDTAMAIFRRWVRNLPLSAADRRHVHHLLIGLGLNPRQAAVFLYCFSSGLCGAVMIGVVCQSEALALILGLAGSVAFLLVLTSRRDELATLRADLNDRLARRRQERLAAKITWEAIQRIELAETRATVESLLRHAADRLGGELLHLVCSPAPASAPDEASPSAPAPGRVALSGAWATFRCQGGAWTLEVSLQHRDEAPLVADIAFRFVQRLAQVAAARIDRLAEPASRTEAEDAPVLVASVAPRDRLANPSVAPALTPLPPRRASRLLARSWLRPALGRWPLLGRAPAPAISGQTPGQD